VHNQKPTESWGYYIFPAFLVLVL